MARGIDPLGRMEVAVSGDGRRLRLSGPLGMGDAERVRELLARSPGVRILEIESPGGRVHEADQIATLVRDRAWHTRAAGDCASACTLVFLSGAQRQLLPGARLGFHRAYAGTLNPVIDEMANQQVAAMYRRAGLPEDFIARVLLTPPWGMWYPDMDELVAGGLVPMPGRTLDIPLDTVTTGQPADTVEVMRTHASWQALERRFPGTLDEAAKRMHEARAKGASDEQVLIDGQRVVQGLLPALLKGTSAKAAEQFARLLAAQLRAAQAAGAPSCRALLAGDAAARRRLPTELVQREADWLALAASQSARDRTAHGPSVLELEVMRRSLGERSPALLRELWGPTGGGGTARDCASALTLLDALAALPPAERQLAGRLAFQQP